MSLFNSVTYFLSFLIPLDDPIRTSSVTPENIPFSTTPGL